MCNSGFSSSTICSKFLECSFDIISFLLVIINFGCVVELDGVNCDCRIILLFCSTEWLPFFYLLLFGILIALSFKYKLRIYFFPYFLYLCHALRYLQLNALVVEQDIYNLKRDCEEKDSTIKELTTLLNSSEVANYKVILIYFASVAVGNCNFFFTLFHSLITPSAI